MEKHTGMTLITRWAAIWIAGAVTVGAVVWMVKTLLLDLFAPLM